MVIHLLAAGSSDHVEAAGFILRGIKGIFVIIGSIIAAILCAVIAAAKGRSSIFYGILGLFFSILTLIVIIVLPSKKNA
jgi:ATP/ADP translocase